MTRMLGSEEGAEEKQALSKKGNPERGASGQEHSVSLGNSTRVERTCAPPPIIGTPGFNKGWVTGGLHSEGVRTRLDRLHIGCFCYSAATQRWAPVP